MEPVSMFVTALGAAAGKTAAAEGLRILKQLVGLQAEQTRLLASVDAKVDVLLERPLMAGIRELELALATHRSPKEQRQGLENARVRLTEAVSGDVEPLRQSFAALHLACIWLALSKPVDVVGSLREAHLHAARAALARSSKAGGGGLWGPSVSGMTHPLGTELPPRSCPTSTNSR